MRSFINALLIVCALFLAYGLYSGFADRTVSFALPPDSLKQWYKPTNERHVWLHVMFKLRREMQAISKYAAISDQNQLVKWSEKLAQDYRKAGEMVPEWQQRMQPQLADELLTAARQGDIEHVTHMQQELGRICKQCHSKYQVVTAAIYRAADFSAIRLDDPVTQKPLTYLKKMQSLSVAMNDIVINLADQNIPQALSASLDLQTGLNELGKTCHHCHTDDSQKLIILGGSGQNRFQQLDKLLREKNLHQAGRLVGEIAVTTCARCHSIHRLAADLRKELIH